MFRVESDQQRESIQAGRGKLCLSRRATPPTGAPHRDLMVQNSSSPEEDSGVAPREIFPAAGFPIKLVNAPVSTSASGNRTRDLSCGAQFASMVRYSEMFGIIHRIII